MGISAADLQHLTAVVAQFARWIERRRQEKIAHGKSGAYTIGITGGQGSGKTTVRRLLERELAGLGVKTAGFSLDDIYKTFEEREALRGECPYFRFRGVFGTHDVELGTRVLREVKYGGDQTVRIPVFDKSLHGGAGDRLPEDQWRTFGGPADVVILEGWCVGGCKQDEMLLAEPICDLERDPLYDDESGSFRGRIDEKLTDYAELFGELDDLIVLHIPDVNCIYRWREKQERDLREQEGSGMDAATLESFVDYFIPSTIRYVLPLGADPDQGATLVFMLDDDQRITGVREFTSTRPHEFDIEQWLNLYFR